MRKKLSADERRCETRRDKNGNKKNQRKKEFSWRVKRKRTTKARESRREKEKTHERNNDSFFFLCVCVCVPVVSVHWLSQCTTTTTGAQESIVRFRLLLLLLHFVGKRIREGYTVASLTSWSNIYNQVREFTKKPSVRNETGESHRRATSYCDSRTAISR